MRLKREKTRYEIGKERWEKLVKMINKVGTIDKKELILTLGFNDDNYATGYQWLMRRINEGNIKETIVSNSAGKATSRWEVIKAPDYSQLAFKNSTPKARVKKAEKVESVERVEVCEPTTAVVIKSETFSLEIEETTQAMVKLIVEKML